MNYLLSLLALKLTGIRRVSHVDDLAADPGAALFAGLTALPKTTALTSYSYRLDHTRQTALLTALGKAMIGADLITDTGGDLDLDFHAIMHWGEDTALEKHYVPSRSQRTRSRAVVLRPGRRQPNPDLRQRRPHQSHPSERGPRLRRPLENPHRRLPAPPGHGPESHQPNRARRTRRPRHHLPHPADALTRPEPAHRLTARHRLAQPCTWTATASTNAPASSTKPPPCRTTPTPVRQLVITGLGRDAATVIITNDRTSTAKQIIERYARRMNIEQRLAESIRSFHTDALAGSVPLNVDLDVALTVLAGAVCAALRRRLTGYHHATPDTLQRTIPVHHRNHHQQRRHHHRPPRPPHLLTRSCGKPPSPTPPSPGGTTAPSTSNTTDRPTRTVKQGSKSLRENPR